MFVYELSGCGFESRCCHDKFVCDSIFIVETDLRVNKLHLSHLIICVKRPEDFQMAKNVCLCVCWDEGDTENFCVFK